MKSDASMLINPMCEVIQYYQAFITKTRYTKNKFDDPIWKRNNKAGSYGFVPSRNVLEITRAFKSVYNYLTKKIGERKLIGRLSFLDAGCGAGNMLLLAYSIGFRNVAGIELDEKTARLARKLLKYTIDRDYHYTITKADITEYGKYKDYNVIYYYQPLYPEHMHKFLDLLRRDMKVGAIVIANGNCRPFKDDRKFKRILRSLDIRPIDGIYEKIR